MRDFPSPAAGSANVAGGGFIVCWRLPSDPALRTADQPVEFTTLDRAARVAEELSARQGVHAEVYQLVAVAPASGHEPKEPRRA